MDPEELKIQEALAEHQKNAPKLGFPTDGKVKVFYRLSVILVNFGKLSNPLFSLIFSENLGRV